MANTYELNLADPGTWLTRHGDAMYAYAMSRVRHPDTAEDLVQESLLAALKNVDGFQNRSEERTWLIGILRHKVIDHIRKKTRSKEVQDPQLGDGSGTMGLFSKRGRWETKPANWGDDPAMIYEDKEFWLIYEACRSKLPTTLAEAYILRELEGLAATEVCNVLDITTSNLGVRLHRARLALRGCLEERWYKQQCDG